MKVDAVLYFNVVNPERAIIQVQHYLPATNMLAQTTLRAVLGQHELDEMLSERKKLSSDVQSILDTQTETWGIKVSNVEIRTVELTDNMVRAIAKQAEAERDRRAKIIHAEAEFQASQTLVNAAQILSSIPAAMQLRYLQTLTEIGAEQNSTVVFPMPIDIIKPFLDLVEKSGKPAGANGSTRVPPAKRLLWPREEDTQVMGSDRRLGAAVFARTIDRPMLAHQSRPPQPRRAVDVAKSSHDARDQSRPSPAYRSPGLHRHGQRS